MILDLEIVDDIYDKLESTAKERGITIKELIRWIIGDYTKWFVPPTLTLRGPVPLPPNPAEQETAEVMKLSGLMIKAMINQGHIKCPDCTMALDVDALTRGKCSNCGAEI